MCVLKKYNPLIKKMMVFTVIFFVYLLASISAYSAVPAVTNLRYHYLGVDKILRIEYSLAYSDSGPVNISFMASTDGGKNFNVLPVTVSGDRGSVIPGIDKRIDWKLITDYPTIDPHTVRFRLFAGDTDHNLTYITSRRDWNDTFVTMVLVPGGTFRMGSYDTPDGMPIYGDELPDHNVSVDSFYMNVSEVTNRQYWDVMYPGHWSSATKPAYWDDPKFNNPSNPDDRPVVGVTWNSAVAYCNLVGKRLPTEAEWERAARGGQLSREFPWGNYLGLDPILNIDSRNYANYAGTERVIDGVPVWEDTAPVCSFLPNDYGLFDIVGNAYEWCSDYYDFYYYTVTETSNPKGPSSGATRSLRGGSCYDGLFPSYLRSATRYSYSPSPTDGIVGFRCVMNVPQ